MIVVDVAKEVVDDVVVWIELDVATRAETELLDVELTRAVVVVVLVTLEVMIVLLVTAVVLDVENVAAVVVGELVFTIIVGALVVALVIVEEAVEVEARVAAELVVGDVTALDELVLFCPEIAEPIRVLALIEFVF